MARRPELVLQEYIDPKAPFFVLIENNGARVARDPNKELGDYKNIIIAGTGKKYRVHYSYFGALNFLIAILGEGNIEILDEQNNIYRLTVPVDKIGSWKSEQLIGPIKKMLGASWIEIVGDPNWQKSTE